MNRHRETLSSLKEAESIRAMLTKIEAIGEPERRQV